MKDRTVVNAERKTRRQGDAATRRASVATPSPRRPLAASPRRRVAASPRLLAAVAGLCALAATPLQSQQTLVIRGGTVHPVSAPEFVGDVVISDGRIVASGAAVELPAGAQTIDATGLHVYPGLFDAVSVLGLTEIGAVDVTVDINELGDFTPHLQTRTAVHPASEHLPVARANGITHTMAVPMSGGGGFGGGSSSGGFPGQGSVFSLAGWTIEEMEIRPGAVMTMQWPALRTREFDRSTFSFRDRPYREAKREQDEAVRRLTEWLDAARRYDRVAAAGGIDRPDLRLDALARVVRGELPVLARVDSDRDIRDVVDFAEKQGIRLIVAGGDEAYKVADLLAQKRIPVILGPTQALPSDADAAYDEAYANPGKLHAAGVAIAFGTFDASDSRTLPYEAAMAIPYGLPRETALRAITLAPAEILGLADQVGSIEQGKLANLIVTDGDPLEITTTVRHLILDGKVTSTDNRHRQLYQKYRSRPRPAAETGSQP